MGKYFAIIVAISLATNTHVSAETFLDKVVVTPLKTPTKIFNLFNNVQIITSKEIKLQGYKSINEILSKSSSISIGSNGGYGQTKSIFLRGTESNHTKVLINGVDLNPGQFTPWEDIPTGTDLLFYEGLHGGVKGDAYDVASLADLLVGVVPITNLEWIQKIHRDNAERGYSAEAIVDTILRRMPDYINHICPQFSRTDINYQRVPTVDTSNPFICRNIPSPDESFVIIHFRKGAREKWGIDFNYLLGMIHDSFMSSPTSIVVNGGKMGFAMELILTPIIHRMIEEKKKLS